MDHKQMTDWGLVNGHLDPWERIIEDDARKAAVVVATAVYHLSMRDELLPRFTKDAMPPLPKPTSE